MFWRITIDDRVYEGSYREKSAAVYGAMLKDQFDSTQHWNRANLEGNMIAVECIDTGSRHPKHKAKRMNPPGLNGWENEGGA